MSDLQPQQPPSPALTTDVQASHELNLMRIEADDFLPSLGAWSQSLGQKLLITAAGSLVVLAAWPWQESVQALGVIRPAGENTIVQSQLDGTLAAVWIKPNQQVRKGEALATLDRQRLDDDRRKLEQELRESLSQRLTSIEQSSDLKQQLQATGLLNRAQVQSAARDVDSAMSTLKFRETEWQRYRSLLSSGAVQASVVDEKQAQTELARNELSKARQSLKEQEARGMAEFARLRQGKNQTETQNREVNKMVEETRARLAEVRRALANSVIKAPTAGTVISSGMRHAQQVIRAGDVLAQIAPLQGDQRIKVNVPSRDVGGIHTNQTAYLRISGCPYPEFGVLKAKVRSVSADTLKTDSSGGQSESAGFEVVLDPASDHLQAGTRRCTLRNGMDAQAEIVTRQTTILGYLLTKMRLLSGA